MNPPVSKTNLLGLTCAELTAFIAALDEKPFRARQLIRRQREVGPDLRAGRSSSVRNSQLKLAVV